MWFDHNPPVDAEITEEDSFERLIVTMGLEHEGRVLERFKEGYHVVEAASVEHTRELMDSGAEIIYQPQFVWQDVFAKPDFLIRHSEQYQAADAKLARSEEKKEIQIQLGLYRRILGNDLPALAFLGNGDINEIGHEADQPADRFLNEMRDILASTNPPAARYSNSKCKACPYYGICSPAFIAEEELTLLYGIESRAAPGIEAQGITTITELSQADPEMLDDVPYLKGFEKKQRAVLQAKAYLNDEDFQLKPIELPEGEWIHFDIEVNPLTQSGDEHVYLWGFLKPPFSKDCFDYVWTDSEADDKLGWNQFLQKIEAYRAEYPKMVLAHFSNYEAVNIRRYAERYDMQDHPTVTWLLGDESPLFDLHVPVKESLVLPVESYGLKQICKHEGLVNFQWQDDDSGSQWSVVQYVNFLNQANPALKAKLKEDILRYNRDDVLATRMLEMWVRKLPLFEGGIAFQ